MCSYLGSDGHFVVVTFVEFLETDGDSFDHGAQLRDQRGDGAGIDPTRQEDAHRHIRNQVVADRVGHSLAHMLLQFLRRASGLLFLFPGVAYVRPAHGFLWLQVIPDPHP